MSTSVKPNKKRKQPPTQHPNTSIQGKEAPQEANATKQQRLSTSKKDIDNIFRAAKTKPAATEEQSSKQPAAAKAAPSKAPAKVVGSKDDLFGTQNNNARRRTEEGYAIYSEDELGLTKRGGDTAKCPFDCDCCY